MLLFSRERNSSAAAENIWYFFQTTSSPDSSRGWSGRNTRSLFVETFRSLSKVTATPRPLLTRNLLYTGVTKDSLYRRVFKIHLTGNNAGRSTLRKSLGCLWGYTFVARDKKPNSTKTKFADMDETSITVWMRKNLLVLFVPNSNFEADEQELIDTFNPPLNLDKNHNTVNLNYRQQLKVLRTRKIGE